MLVVGHFQEAPTNTFTCFLSRHRAKGNIGPICLRGRNGLDLRRPHVHAMDLCLVHMRSFQPLQELVPPSGVRPSLVIRDQPNLAESTGTL